VVLTVPLLVGLDGVEKMSKSKGNHVGITDAPHDMFGKIMSISDETMATWFPLLLGRELDADAHPRDQKLTLAAAIVQRFHGEAAAQETGQWWSSGRPTDEAKTAEVAVGPLFKVVLEAGAASSGGDARRKIAQGGVALNGERLGDAMQTVEAGEYELRVGKKWSARITVR
jgi:tyrosyl-tRNA synthetase